MNIELPLETWAILLGFLPRSYLGGIVPRIGNRQLATIIQFYLHQYGEVRLGNLEIVYGDGVAVQKWTCGDCGPPVPIDADPANEIPKNVRDFDALTLSHFGNPMVLPWLRKFQRHSLFTNVNLHLQSLALNGTLRTLDTLLPLLDSIESVRIQDQHVLANIGANWLPRARILQVCFVGEISSMRQAACAYGPTDRVCRWLNTSHHSNEPRVLSLSLSGPFYVQYILKHFEQNFIHADKCASYFVRFHVLYREASVENNSLQNTRTKETFSIKTVADETGGVLVSRLPEQANPGWIAEKEKEVMGWDYYKQSRRIHITEPLIF